MQVKLHIPRLKANAPHQPTGYAEFILARGKIAGDFVELDEAALTELYEKYPNPLAQPTRRDPGIAKMSANFATAMSKWARSGFKKVEEEEYERRFEICMACEHWDGAARAGMGKCRICGCTKAKLWLATSSCPLQPPKWASVASKTPPENQ